MLTKTGMVEESEKLPPNGDWPAGTTGMASGIWKLEKGCVEVWRNNLLIGLRRAGDYVGALGLLNKQPQAWTAKPGPDDRQLASFVHVREDAQARPVNAKHLSETISAGGPEAVDIARRLARAAEAFDHRAGEAFLRFTAASFPGLSHQAPPPPYVCADATLYTLPCAVPDTVFEMLPPFLNVTSDKSAEGRPAGLLNVLRYRRYHKDIETTQAWISVPVREKMPPHRDALYVVWQFADNAEALLVGREIFGLPSMYGSLIVEGNEDETQTRLIGAMGGQRVFDLHLDSGPDYGPVPALKTLLELVGPCLTRVHAKLNDEEREAFGRAIEQLADLDPQKGPAIRKAICEGLKPPMNRGKPSFWGLTRLSWARTFKPSTPAEDWVEWNPDQFASDGLLPSWLGLQSIEQISVQRVRDQKDDPPAVFEFFVQGRQEEFKVLASAALVAKIKLHVPPGKRGRLGLDTDYPARVRNLLNNPQLLPRLAWGPKAWGQAAKLPEADHSAWKHAQQERRGRLHLRVGREPRKVAGEDFPGIKARLRKLPSTYQHSLPPGHGLPDWLFTQDQALFVLEGEIDVWQVDRYAGPRVAGEFLHERVDGLPRAEVCARTPTQVLVFKLSELWEMLGRTRPWASEDTRFAQLLGYSAVRSGLRTSAELEAATYQAFPGARAVVLPGPYKADEVVQFNMPVRRCAALEALLPPRVDWHPMMPFALFFVARFAGFGPAQPKLAKVIQGGAAYCECGMMIPTRVRGRKDMRLFVPWIFPTSLMAMFAGREIYGYPKTWSTIEIQEDTLSSGRLMVRRGGVTMADLSYDRIRGLSTASNVLSSLSAPLATALTPEFLKTVQVLCHKRLWNGIARRQKLDQWNATYFSVDRLADSGFQVGQVKRLAPIRLREKTIRLNVPRGLDNAPAEIELQTFDGLGSRVEYQMVMTTGGSPVNYLGPTTNLDQEERRRLAPEPKHVKPERLEHLAAWMGDWINA